VRYVPATPAAGGHAGVGLIRRYPGWTRLPTVSRMSDFDAVLERLLVDPAFAADLACDPDRALAGYRLDDGEADLLRNQVAADCGADAARVEARTTKSSTFGLLSALGDFTGAGAGAARAADRLGDLAGGHGTGGGATGSMRAGLGEAPRAGLGEAGGRGTAEPAYLKAPEGYRNKVDADGDGDWDRATYRGRRDGGVDILVDLNGDGRADFIGHDKDRDWTVDSADFDKDHDGVFEKRMYDDDGDGLLDRSVRRR
jgi:hypothetical protein